MADKIKLRLMYKTETSRCAMENMVCAHIGKWGDVICEDELNEESMESVKTKGYFTQQDSEYVEWLEEKLMEML